MIPQLNFIRQHRTDLAHLRTQDKYILWGTIGFFGLSLVITLSLVGWLFFSKRKYQSLVKAQSEVENQLAKMSRQQAEYLVYSTRLNLLAELMPDFVSQLDSLEFITTIAKPGVEFYKVEYEGGRTLTFQVTADSFFSFEGFVDGLRQDEVKDNIGFFKLDGLSRNEEGAYRFEVVMGNPPEES